MTWCLVELSQNVAGEKSHCSLPMVEPIWGRAPQDSRGPVKATVTGPTHDVSELRAPSISFLVPESRHSVSKTKWRWHNGGSLGQPAVGMDQPHSRGSLHRGECDPAGRVADLSPPDSRRWEYEWLGSSGGVM